MNLQRMRQLAGIKLNESVSAIPGIGKPNTVMHETAPPGMEDMVMKLKKEYPDDHERAFATAWSIYNKKHGAQEESSSEMEEGLHDGPVPLDPRTAEKMRKRADAEKWARHAEDDRRDKESGQNPHQVDETDDNFNPEHNDTCEWALGRFQELTNSFVDPQEALHIVMKELEDQGSDTEEIKYVHDAIMIQNSDTDYGDNGDLDYDDEMSFPDTQRNGGWEIQQDDTADEEFEESYDLNNGYDDVEHSDGSDFFPTGADSPVINSTGVSGARHGDNPEQKKIQVAEVHKELVYGYRDYLKETKSTNKKK